MIVWEQVHTERLSSGGDLAVRGVRAYVRRTLVAALEDRAHDFDLDDIDLMVCEITTNAVRHSASGDAGRGVWVTILVAKERIRVEIQDDGGSNGCPVIPPQGSGWGESGRGLMVVNGLADCWGTLPGARGRFTVWFEVTG
ncbi:ATP-binding protein [Actinomadura sp. 9N407]|uniref:ATP-binding protein n=1 Tax=Actinomadura sp. 9N407 TaxID=3375154 RepID=UPI0037B5160C